MAAMTPGEIEIRIDEVVLEGTDASGREAVADALRTELARLFTTRPPTLDAPAQVDRLRVAPLGVSMQAPAEALGTAIAASLHAGFAP